MSEQKQKLYEIISNVLSISKEDISEKTSSENLEVWDSLNQMRLILAIEDSFNITFNDEIIYKMIDYKTIINEIKLLLK